MAARYHKIRVFVLMGFIFSLAIAGFIPGNVFADGEAGPYESSFVPWSGFWWPYDKCGLATGSGYYNHPAPLEKYELYTRAAYPGTLTQWYIETHCENSPLPWYGHCGHWALAASSENIEFLPSVLNNIVFGVGDKKGLLTLGHNDDTAIRGDGSRPEEFHYWLLKYLKDEKKAFVADLSTGQEIWQFPIYKFEIFEQETIGNRESYKVKVTYPTDDVHPDFIGSQEQYKFYYYDLLLDDQGNITGGEWTGNSVDDHPEAMFLFLTQGTTAPLFDYDVVKQIALSKDDELESQSSAVILPPGEYNLVLLDPDNYILDSHAGDGIRFGISLVTGGGYDLSFEIRDKENTIVAAEEFTIAEASFQVLIPSENPPYTLSVTKNDYSIPGIYQISFDLDKKQNHAVPYIPKSGMYSGFAITNASDITREKINIVAYSKEGKPMQTLMGPMDMTPGEKKTFLFRDLPYRAHDLSSIESLRILSDQSIGVTNVMRNDVGHSAGIDQGRYKGSHLIIPDTAAIMSFNKSIFWQLTNEGMTAATFTLSLYNALGNLEKTSNPIFLEPKASFALTTNQEPFYSMPDSGWIELIGVNGDESISAYQQTTYLKGGMETLFALPVQSSRKILPHIPDSDYWNASVILINPGTSAVQVKLHPVMAGSDTSTDHSVSIPAKTKTELNLHEIYDRAPTDPYYRSITELTSDGPFIGYYQHRSSEFADTTMLPLLEDLDFSSTLDLSHNTGIGGYWTGLCVLNPDADNSASVLLKPYDKNGNVLASLEKEFALRPGEYIASAVSQFYPDDYGDISFMKIQSKDTGQKLGGFFIYGCKEFGLWGSNLAVDDNN